MPPRVSVGLPVYNGENYITEAIDSILNQTYSDFELVISDNASSDDTEDICRNFAAGDERIRYVRNASNLGAGPNINQVFRLSEGELFKLANHDDVCDPKFLELCVQALDERPSIVSAFPSTIDIDHDGEPIRSLPRRPAFASTDLATRVWEALRFGEEPMALFGVMRSSVVAKTGLMPSVPSGDRIWLAELVMHGPFTEVEQPLFRHREHPNRSVYAAGKGHDSMAWWDTTRARRISFPYWRMMRELARAIRRSPLSPPERRQAFIKLLRWSTENKHHLKLTYDFAVPLRPLIDKFYRGATSTRG